ncbi:histidine kinase [Geodermatophilus sp. SYSU D00814]
MDHRGAAAPEQQQPAAAIPAPRTGSPAPDRTDGGAVLRALGLDALVDLLESANYGVCITGEDHSWVYLNPAGAAVIGRPFAELAGQDYLQSFAEHERAALLELEHDQRAGDTGFYANTVVRPDGTEVGITWSGSVLRVGDRELAPAVFHPTFGLGPSDADAVVPGAAAAGIAEGAPVEEVLASLAREAVDRSRALGCLLLAEADESDEGRLLLRASAGLPPGTADAVAEAGPRTGDLPGGELLTAGRLLLLSDGRQRLERSSPRLAEHLAGLCWQGAAALPLHRGGRTVGCLLLLMPASVTAPTKSELTSWSALGAHASVALADEQLRAQAAELERRRLGRDLHDSLSASLFSLHARAQAVRRGLAAGDAELVAAAARDLEELSRQAVAELRATVTGIRGGSPDLAGALGDLARTCTARDGLPVRLRVAADLPAVGAGPTEHLVRIAAEALHNCVKHARAGSAELALEVRGSELVLTVADDGRGFHPAAPRGGGHGQRTMRERALLCGGWLHVDSAPGRGTRLVVRVPLPG